MSTSGLNRAARTLCKHYACCALIETGTGGYCEKHIPKRNRDPRLYDYRWQQFRIAYLQEHPLCADCEKDGLVTVAQDIHHIHKLKDYPALKYDTTNLMPLCHSCHAERTARGE